jgi:hypothetical protein
MSSHVTCCSEVEPGVTVCRGPATRKVYTDTYRSAAWCQRCRRRRVHRLVWTETVEPSYYEPHPKWECPCARITWSD